MNGRLVIIDWGIGGISIYKLLRESGVDVPVTYFSDTGATPYGKMSRRELSQRLDAVITWLAGQGATHIVIGCNAASTAIPQLSDIDIPILGMIEPAVDVASRMKPARLAVIGGRRTVLSGVYRDAFAARGITVEQRIAQPLSALIEGGDMGSADFHAAARRILTPIRNSSHILLACTHYPAAAESLRRHVSGSTEFIDPAGEVVRRIAEWSLGPTPGDDAFYTTGDPRAMKKAALLAFGVRLHRVRSCHLSSATDSRHSRYAAAIGQYPAIP
jgi:glutamate racemase